MTEETWAIRGVYAYIHVQGLREYLRNQAL